MQNHLRAVLLCFISIIVYSWYHWLFFELEGIIFPAVLCYIILPIGISLLSIRYLKVPLIAYKINPKWLAACYIFSVFSGLWVEVSVSEIVSDAMLAGAEEITDRLFLFSALCRWISPPLAILYSAIVFAFNHFSDFNYLFVNQIAQYRFIYLVGSGIIYAWFYFNFRSVFLVTTLHLYKNVFIAKVNWSQSSSIALELFTTIVIFSVLAYFLVKFRYHLIQGKSNRIFT